MQRNDHLMRIGDRTGCCTLYSSSVERPMLTSIVLGATIIVFIILVVGITRRNRRTNADPGWYAGETTGVRKDNHVEANTGFSADSGRPGGDGRGLS